MTDLADFLRARYGEDAAAVRANWNRDGITSERYHGTCIDPPRLLADIDAKLALVDAYVGAEKALDAWTCPDDRIIGHADGLDDALRLLAQPFAGHAEYKEEWRP